MKRLREQGKVCVFLCDDNVWEIPQGNPARETYQQADIIHRYQTIMETAHAVTTSTSYLVDKCKNFNSHVTLFRNLIDPAVTDMVSPGRDDPDEIRIGWTGTPHHHDDAALLDEACLQILYNFPKVKFIFMGYNPPSLFTKYPPGRFEYYSFVPVDAWYPAFASLDIDIGLVPLIDHPFNLAKTCRKFQEFSQIKAATIASPIGNYKDLPKDIITLVPENLSPKSWITCITYLITHPEERKRRGDASYQYVLNNHDINTYIYERAQFYYDTYARVTGTERTIVWDETLKRNV